MQVFVKCGPLLTSLWFLPGQQFTKSSSAKALDSDPGRWHSAPRPCNDLHPPATAAPRGNQGTTKNLNRGQLATRAEGRRACAVLSDPPRAQNLGVGNFNASQTPSLRPAPPKAATEGVAAEPFCNTKRRRRQPDLQLAAPHVVLQYAVFSPFVQILLDICLGGF